MASEILTIYSRYRQLTQKQRRHLLAALQQQGISVIRIEAYEYPDAPGIKHMFFYFQDSPQNPIPYFLLPPQLWQTIQDCVMGEEN